MQRPSPRSRQMNRDPRTAKASSSVSSWLNFTPLSLAPAVWLDASDATTITESSGSVSQWNDKSGNNLHVTQGTAAAQPTTNIATLNNLNVLSFDGGDILTAAAAIDVGSLTIFVVANQNNNADFAGLVVLAPSSGNDQSSSAGAVTQTGPPLEVFVAERLNPGQVTSAIAGSGATPSAVYVGLYRDDGQVQSFSNTARGSTVTVGSGFTTSTTLLIGGRYQSGAISASFRLNGRIGEIIVFSNALEIANINAVGQYLSKKWGFLWANK